MAETKEITTCIYNTRSGAYDLTLKTYVFFNG
ncbi:MAG: hypothetical protein RLZZ595_1937 [Bacteroidota bacterium]